MPHPGKGHPLASDPRVRVRVSVRIRVKVRVRVRLGSGFVFYMVDGLFNVSLTVI